MYSVARASYPLLNSPLRLQFFMLSISCLLVGLTLCSTNEVNARSRCRVDDPQLKSLSKSLERAETPMRWRAIYQDAAAALTLIEKRYDHRSFDHNKDQQALLISQLRCVKELLLESAFFLSDDRIEGKLWAMRAVGHAVSLSSLTQTSLRDIESRERLQLIIKRANGPLLKRKRLHRVDPSPLGSWTNYHVAVQNRPYRLHLEVAQKEKWLKRCGLIAHCESAIRWRVYTKRGDPLSFKLPAGLYNFSWSGACIQHSEQRQLSPSPSSVALIAPSMHCYSQLSLTDEITKAEISLKGPEGSDREGSDRPILEPLDSNDKLLQEESSLRVPEGIKLRVKLKGYYDREVEAPLLGAPLSISLKRCPVPIKRLIKPEDATVKVPQKVFWGLPYSMEVSRAGYKTTTRTIIAPRPDNCEEASPYLVKLQLPREVSIEAYAPDGSIVKLSSLKVSGLPISTQSKHFYRPVGRYKVEAKTTMYPDIITGVSIPSCLTESCTEAELTLRFQAPPRPPTSIAKRLKWTGVSALFTGLSLLSFNALNHREREQNLLYVSDLSLVKSQMTTINQWSVGLLISGGLTALLGYAWPALTSGGGKGQNISASPADSMRRN